MRLIAGSLLVLMAVLPRRRFSARLRLHRRRRRRSRSPSCSIRRQRPGRRSSINCCPHSWNECRAMRPCCGTGCRPKWRTILSRFYAAGGPWEKMEKWMEIPLGDPAREGLSREELVKDASMLYPRGLYAAMERAARFESCDWEQPIREGNYIGMLLPEIQQSRTYARMLSAKRIWKLPKANTTRRCETLQTGYAEARQVGAIAAAGQAAWSASRSPES